MTRRRWWLTGGAAALIVAAVAGVLIWQAMSRPVTAEEAATAYLRALESGDPASVEATGIEVPAAALKAFDGATELIEDAEVSAVDEDADGVTTVEFVSIGREAVPVDEEIPLLPAGYPVAASPSTLLGGESTALVLPGESVEVALEAALLPEATEAAQQVLDELLATCTQPGDAPPGGCGIRIPWGTEFQAVSDLRYRVERLPALSLTATGFAADGGVLTVTATGTGQDGAPRTTTYRTESWSVRGDVTFTADDVVLSPW